MWLCSAFCCAPHAKFATMSASGPTAQGHALCLVIADWAVMPLSNSDHEGQSSINIKRSPKKTSK